MLDGGSRREYSPSSSAAGFADEYCYATDLNLDLVNNTADLSKKKQSSRKNKRRFSDDQIRSLETMFGCESKLEPRKKVELARELGLQTRQVAIWFQNKRARWKSNQLQTDFRMLQTYYNALASQFENLKKERQYLVTQLQKLNELIVEKCKNEDSILIKNSSELDVKSRLFLERTSENDDSISIKPAAEYGLGLLDEEEEAAQLLNMVETADSSLTSPEELGGSLVGSDHLLLQPSSSYQWWDFLT